MLQVKISRLYKNYLRFIITTLEKKKSMPYQHQRSSERSAGNYADT